MRSGLVAIVSCTLLAGCPDTAVFVEPTITVSSIEVTTSGLVTGVSGEIQLELHLGPRASGPGEVTLSAISLTSGDRKTTLVDSIGATPTPRFPITVGVDGDATVSFTVSADDNLLAADAVDTLCGSGDLSYVIVLDGSLRGGSVSAAASPVTPTGCP